ncbi:MAG: phenylalanine--tRNA ligase subunit alpha [Culicoidibacterales bacterium]
MSEKYTVLEQLLAQALVEVQTDDLKSLNGVRVKYLGKKGPIQEAMQAMKGMEPEARKEFGQLVNTVKSQIAAAVEARLAELEQAAIDQRLVSETIDITLPAHAIQTGGLHPLQQVVDDITAFFRSMGYEAAEGPEVETDFYNFEMLNLPHDHPARDMQDSFYVDPHRLLRTHTSGVQARTFEARTVEQLPIKVICPGKVYRRDDDDATHSHQFMQIEAFIVDKNVSMANLKGTLQALARHLFGADREIRLRPSFFPFTEPSVEVDVSCAKCNGAGCNVCKQTGWIEILGAGLIHPNVLTMTGFNPEEVSGFALGMGVERIAMLKYGIEDIRHFYVNDVRFLNQFKR